MKKALIILLSLILLAAAAAVILYPPYKAMKEADALLSQGSYAEAVCAYGSVIQQGTRALPFKERAEAGIAAGAEAALAAGDENFLDLCATEGFVRPEGEAAAARFDAATGALEKIRSDRIAAEREAERLERERRAREEEKVRIACLNTEKAFLARAAKVRQEEREAEFEAAVLSHDHLLALSVVETMETEQARTVFTEKAAEAHKIDIPRQRKTWQPRFGAGTWYTAVLGDTLLIAGDARYSGGEMPVADSICTGDFGILLIRDGVPSFYGDSLGASKEIAGMNDIVAGAVGMNHALLVHGNGKVTAVGAKQYDKADVDDWRDITSVAAGAFHSVGLDKRGYVVAVGLNADGQCDTRRWRNVVAVSAGMRHTVGLLSDGHVVAAGDNTYGQCDVSEWTDIEAIVCGPNHTVGLRKDGTTVAVGDNSARQCEVGEWSHVIAIGAGMWHTSALLEDGRVVAIGSNENGQCDTEGMRAFTVTEYDVSYTPVLGHSEEYVYVRDEKDGPWVYYAKEGAVVISLEDSYDLVATRADLFCTEGVFPEGILSGGGDKPAGTNMGTTLAKQNKSVFAINGDYFNFDYNPDGIQIRRGIVFKNVISDNKRSLGVAFWPDNTMRVVDSTKITADGLLALGIRDSWVFGPLLVLDGEAQDISYSPLSYNDVTLRSAIGSVCAYHHIALSCGRGTLAEVTQLFLDYGCEIAYNLDGGRSVWMTFMGQRVNRTYFNKAGTRNLSDMVGFLHSEQVH